MIQRFLTFLTITLLLASCGSDKSSDLATLNLMQYDIPVAIMAPDSAKVKVGSMSGMLRDVTIMSEDDNFAVQVFSGQAFTQDLAKLKAGQLDLVRGNRYFERIVEEDPSGFIFENKIDSTANFGFRHVIFKGDKEITFQNGMGQIFTEAEARKMYAAVKQN